MDAVLGLSPGSERIKIQTQPPPNKRLGLSTAQDRVRASHVIMLPYWSDNSEKTQN